MFQKPDVRGIKMFTAVNSWMNDFGFFDERIDVFFDIHDVWLRTATQFKKCEDGVSGDSKPMLDLDVFNLSPKLAWNLGRKLLIAASLASKQRSCRLLEFAPDDPGRALLLSYVRLNESEALAEISKKVMFHDLCDDDEDDCSLEHELVKSSLELTLSGIQAKESDADFVSSEDNEEVC